MAAIWSWYKKRAPIEKAARTRVQASGSERRGPVRYVARARAVLNLITISSKASRTVQVQDVSIRGVGMVTTSPVELGAFFVLEIGPASAPTGRFKGRVVRQVQGGKGSWIVGGVFLAELTEAQLNAFL